MKTRFLFTIALAANCVREGLTHVRRLQVGDDEMAGEARYLVTGQISDIVASRKVKTYDHKLVDKSAEKIVKAVKATGAIISGPIPLPTHKRIYTVNRSTFVNKKAREQFQLSDYKRLIDIYSSTAKTVDALMKLELPSGVEVEIKV